MKTILLIEDNLHIRENAAELLELAGYKVLTCSNGQSGIETAIAELPDIILSDIMMPVLNGHQVFEQLRSIESTKNIPFVFITSNSEKKEVQIAMQNGASGYITKPFDEKDLYDTVKSCLKD
jgi:CheY-like chemotaxis protein